jgi:hypothetical protein
MRRMIANARAHNPPPPPPHPATLQHTLCPPSHPTPPCCAARCHAAAGGATKALSRAASARRLLLGSATCPAACTAHATANPRTTGCMASGLKSPAKTSAAARSATPRTPTDRRHMGSKEVGAMRTGIEERETCKAVGAAVLDRLSRIVCGRNRTHTSWHHAPTCTVTCGAHPEPLPCKTHPQPVSPCSHRKEASGAHPSRAAPEPAAPPLEASQRGVSGQLQMERVRSA